ncbi:LCP family protein [Fonticella tunisiensis]|nr:LCP family protein [Fonticella tunisiensis]
MRKKLLIIIIPVMIIVGVASGTFFYVNNKIHVKTQLEEIFDNPEEQEQAKIEEEKGLTNILLIGVDSREGEKTGRTDSIILATIDANNRKVKLTSFMRDMYVPIPGHGNNRINAAYTLGGPELLIKTLNQDFGLNIQYFASIDFKAFQDVVDKLGGIDLEIKDYEVNEINKYIIEVNGKNATLIKSAGMQHLNGQQALSYSRIRKVGNGDYERTERQRRVISLLIDKAKKTSLLKLPDLFSTLLPHIKTNVPTTKLMSLGYTVYKFSDGAIQNLRIPGDGMFQNMVIENNGVPMDILVPDLAKNVAMLNKFIYSSGGTVASNMPSYMVNNFHSKDIALDNRGKKRSIMKIEIPKPKPKETEKPEVQQQPKETEKHDVTQPKQEQNTGNNSSTDKKASTGTTETGGKTNGGTGNETGQTPNGENTNGEGQTDRQNGETSPEVNTVPTEPQQPTQ